MRNTTTEIDMLMSAVGTGILQSVHVPVGLQAMHESRPYISCWNTRYVPRYLEVTSPVDGTPGRSSSLFGRSLCLLLPRFQTGACLQHVPEPLARVRFSPAFSFTYFLDDMTFVCSSMSNEFALSFTYAWRRTNAARNLSWENYLDFIAIYSA